MFSHFALHTCLKKQLAELKFTEPTPVQSATIPAAMEGNDLLVSAETGSGKTAAFLLPTLHRLLTQKPTGGGTRALILVPTRELAKQVTKQSEKLAAASRLQVGVITGGASFKYQFSLLRKEPEVLIATPGRLLEHIERGTTDFSDLEVLVLDEADRMLDMGMSEDVLQIVELCNSDRQTLLFSATLNHRGLKKITDHVMREPTVIKLSGARDQHSSIRQQIVPADDNIHKEALLTWLLNNETFQKAMVFTNTRVQADKIGNALRSKGVRANALHGDMDQDSRNQVMEMLRGGIINVLVGTDVAARGLDVKGVDLVINFDMARNGTDYVHRIGRTGRAGEEGLAISLIAAQEWNLMSGIEHYLRLEFEKRTIKELKGGYNGPKKQKRSGKAAGSKKSKSEEKQKANKVKQRHRDKKNVGKRRKPSSPKPDAVEEAGFAPLKRNLITHQAQLLSLWWPHNGTL
ncbi:MAG: DEAD/DEAH box helicase [Candidatus Sedimenticola sp. (ex Thyasira tokunagai)]